MDAAAVDRRTRDVDEPPDARPPRGVEDFVATGDVDIEHFLHRSVAAPGPAGKMHQRVVTGKPVFQLRVADVQLRSIKADVLKARRVEIDACHALNRGVRAQPRQQRCGEVRT